MGGGPDLPLRLRKEVPAQDEPEEQKHLRAIVDMGRYVHDVFLNFHSIVHQDSGRQNY